MFHLIHHKSHKPAVLDYAKFSDRERRIYSFLKHNPIAVLSTVTPYGTPHGSIIYYAVDSNFSFSFLTRKMTQKYNNLSHHSDVMLSVYEPVTQTSVEVHGIAEEISDNYRINLVAASALRAALMTSDAGLPPVSRLDAGEYAAFAIAPTTISMAVFARPTVSDPEDIFESIESFDFEPKR